MGLTNSQRILIAAAALPGEWSPVDLVVRAYEDNRAELGLRGHADRYPDSNKILAAVMGRRGLLNPERGFVLKVGPKRYRLTNQGRAEAARVIRPAPPKRLDPVRPPGPLDRRIRAVVDAVALRRWRAGAGGYVSFPEAAAFLAADPEAVDGLAAEYFVGGKLRLRSGQVVGPEDLRAARLAADYFRERFGRRLAGNQSPENRRTV